MLHFNIDISRYKEVKLNSSNYINISLEEIENDSSKLEHYKNCKKNFDINLNRFKSLDKYDFNQCLRDFLRKYPQFIEIKDLNNCNYSGYYIMVLDDYCQIYIGTSRNIKDRIVSHWRKKMPFERLIFGNVETSKLSIDSFLPLDTTRIFVYKTDVLFNDEDRFIGDFPNKYLLNRTIGGKLDSLTTAYINRKEYVEDEELTMIDLMKMLQCSRNKVINLYVYNNLPLYKKGNRYFAKKMEVEVWYKEYLKNQKQEYLIMFLTIIIIPVVVIITFIVITTMMAS